MPNIIFNYVSPKGQWVVTWGYPNKSVGFPSWRRAWDFAELQTEDLIAKGWLEVGKPRIQFFKWQSS